MQLFREKLAALKIPEVQPRCTFFDLQSTEKTTDIIKRKYKVAANILKALSIYSFFITTSHYDSCCRWTTITVTSDEWEDRDPEHLKGVSYIDLKKIEVLSKEQIISKIADEDNGFKKVAILPAKKFIELSNLVNNLNCRQVGFVPDKTRDIIDVATSTKKEADEILKKWGLS